MIVTVTETCSKLSIIEYIVVLQKVALNRDEWTKLLNL